MDIKLVKLIQKIEESIQSDNFIDVTYDIIDEIQESDNSFDAVEPLLKIIEKYPNNDIGLPGPIVHFVESFYLNGYEEKLVASLRRRPTKHSVWMLNRIINGSSEEKKSIYLNELKRVAESNELEEDVVDLARQFITCMISFGS